MRFRIIMVKILIIVFILLAGCGKVDEDTLEIDMRELGEPVVLAYSYRTLTNPYYIYALKGIELFIESVKGRHIEFLPMEHANLDEKQITDIKSAIAKGGRNTIVIVDPNQIQNVYEMKDIFEEAGVYWTTIWTRPDDLHPKDYHYYVAHQALDDVEAGYEIAKEMVERFRTPGKGRILAIQGNLTNDAAINRFKGLEKALAEYKDVELLDDQSADWEPRKAFEITETWLSKYDNIDGIWCVNDSMGLAVVEALKAKNLAGGKVKVVGIDGISINAIKAGDILASVSPVPWSQTGYAAAITYAAYNGDIDPDKMTEEQMVFYTKGVLITSENVESFEEEWINNNPTLDFSDPFATVYRQQIK